MNERVAIVGLGRPQGMGEQRRRESWEAMLTHRGFEVHQLAATRSRRPGRRELSGLLDVVRGRIVPESLGWNLRSLQRDIDTLRPDALVLLTARCYRPALTDRPIVLDFVDRLSESYASRARIISSPTKSLAFRLLSWCAARFEAQPIHVPTAAAGWMDARALGAAWLPNVIGVSPPSGPEARPDHDLLFFGNLAYPPNAVAVQWLAERWPLVERRRPGTTLLIAGRNPDAIPTLRRPPSGWEVQGPFADLGELCARARVAIAPIVHANGMQNKVLEAAAFGLPQVITEHAAAGLGPGFAGIIADGDALLWQALDLVEDAPRLKAMGEASRQWAMRFSPEAWSRAAAELLDTASGG